MGQKISPQVKKQYVEDIKKIQKCTLINIQINQIDIGCYFVFDVDVENNISYLYQYIPVVMQNQNIKLTIFNNNTYGQDKLATFHVFSTEDQLEKIIKKAVLVKETNAHFQISVSTSLKFEPEEWMKKCHLQLMHNVNEQKLLHSRSNSSVNLNMKKDIEVKKGNLLQLYLNKTDIGIYYMYEKGNSDITKKIIYYCYRYLSNNPNINVIVFNLDDLGQSKIVLYCDEEKFQYMENIISKNNQNQTPILGAEIISSDAMILPQQWMIDHHTQFNDFMVDQ